MAYVWWMVAAMLAVVGFVLLVFVPGLALLAGVALAIGLVLGAVLLVGRGAAKAGAGSSDIEERRAEHEERQQAR